MIKLVALDLDGTTLDPEKKITPAVKEAVSNAKKAGIKVVICSGRPLMGIQPILDELELSQPGDYVIAYNGGLIQKTDTGEEVSKNLISRNDFLDIDAAARKVGVPMMALTKDGIYTSQRDIGKYVVHETHMMQMPLYVRLPEEIAELDIVKCMMVDDQDKLDNAIAYLPFDFFDQFSLSKSSTVYLEVMHPASSKGKGILALSEILGIDPADVMAIGDQDNDRPMLEVVGHPIAMGNGTDSLKKMAEHVTKSNAESGVAYAINKWALGIED